MASENMHPTGDTGTGAVIGTRRLRTAQDLVADVADVAATDTKIMTEAALREGEMVQKPTPPHQYGQKTRGVGQNGHGGGRSE